VVSWAQGCRQNKENPDMKWHGEIKVDKEGNLRYIPKNPNEQAWAFTRDRRAVMVSRD